MPVRLERRGDLALATLDRPEALNALSFALVREISARLDEAAASGARGLVVTGAGDRAFCAGADISELVDRPPAARRADIERGQRVFDRLANFPVPTLAVVRGFALGGGLELAMACDFRLAAPNARMGLPEIGLGVIPGYGGTQRLPRLVGEGRALELVASGRAVDAEEAERIGLANGIVGADGGDPLEEGIAWLARVARRGLPALGLARAAVRRALDLPVGEGLKVEADLNTLAFQTEDAAEGLSAFLEKRRPKFRDR